MSRQPAQNAPRRPKALNNAQRLAKQQRQREMAAWRAFRDTQLKPYDQHRGSEGTA